MSAAVTPKKIWTEAEIEALPEDGYIHEIVNGELVMSPKNNFQHGDICTRLLVALETFNRAHRLGVVTVSALEVRNERQTPNFKLQTTNIRTGI